MAAVQRQHPLPAPPGHGSQVPGQGSRYQYQQQNQPQKPGSQNFQQRPRSKSSFSFRSDRSHKSSGSVTKIDLTETHQEKQSRRLTSKADPTLAMNEAEPSAIAINQSSMLAPLRAIQHLDAVGNPIAEPDRSNPTRSRWERPLDTIRSFEAAIDGNYSRKSMIRTESSPAMAGSGYNTRRSSSYFGGGSSNVGGYYGPRQNMHRPESYYDGGADHRNGGQGPSNGYAPARQRYPRTASEPMLHNAGAYPPNGPQQSYETVTTASGSGGSYNEPAGYTTDPSSENSSIDRAQAAHQDAYGYNGNDGLHMQQPPMRAYNSSHGYGGPSADMSMINENKAAEYRPRAPIKLGGNPGAASAKPGVYEPPKAEKRRSWLGRRFSKS